MRAPRLIEVTDLDPAEIDVSVRLRPASPAGVAALIASIGELGIVKDEVAVRRVRHQNNRLVLMAGLHRVEACRQMGRKVPAKIWDCSDDWARLVEVDDNLAGADLCALDQAVFLAERKAIYEKLYPHRLWGGDRKSLKWRYYEETHRLELSSIRSAAAEEYQTDAGSFCSATAEKFGITDRQIRKIVAAGSRLSAGDVAALRQAPRPVTLADLQQVAKTTSDGEHRAVVSALAEGREKNAAAARRRYLATQPGGTRTLPKDPDEVAWIALDRAWAACRKVVRRKFVERNEPALAAMLAELRASGAAS